MGNSNFIKAAIILMFAVLIAAFTVFLSFGLSNKITPTGRSGQELTGKTAPGFTAPLVNGDFVNLSDYKDSIVVLNFWASWCPPCRTETPTIEKLWKKYREQNVVMLGINVQDGFKTSIEYIDEFAVTFPNGLDLDGNITVNYGVTGIPVTFFIDKNGIIISRWVGSITEIKLESIILDLLNEFDENILENGENPEGIRKLK
jgi:cytochrome c biogenesis protein CcmG/thiol:disulfide interchange protein DsbE